jgi:very-short-patch-repair endonuclease
MTIDGRDARLALIASRQAASFSFAQALATGFPRATISRRLARGTWERRHPGVFALAGSEPTWSQRLWVAWLAAGGDSVLTHETSALLHGAERLPSSPVVLTNPHGWHHHIDGVFVHQIDDLVDPHRTTHWGLPVSTPARCVVELGATQTTAVVGRVADDLVRLRRTTFARIARVLADVTRPGKPGLERVGRVLEERMGGVVPPGSELERALFAALEAGGLPRPERQVRLPGTGIAGLVDGAYSDAKLILEADGRRWHARVEAARADRERDAQAARAGWQTLRFVYEQIVHDPAEVCAVVAETRAARLSLLVRAA